MRNALTLATLATISIKESQAMFAEMQTLSGDVHPLVHQLWRAETRQLVKFDGDSEDDAANLEHLEWTRVSYLQTQVHVWDKSLWDGEKFTVEKYVQEQKDLFGGLDSVLLWHAYPNLGLDEKNQFEVARSLPNGGYKEMIDAFHKEGVKVLFNYIPWDQINDFPGMQPEQEQLADYMGEVGFDGFNCDTCLQVGEEFWNASHGFAIEPELGGTLWTAKWTPMAWGYYGYANGARGEQLYRQKPGIVKQKYLNKHGRFLSHVTDRWGTDRLPPLQYALFNGVGYNTWENVWGIYNKITDRDAEAIRQFVTVSRFLGKYNYTSNYRADGWFPYCSRTRSWDAVSRFEHVNGDIAWTVANMKEHENHTAVLDVTGLVSSTARFYDLFNGEEIFPVNNLLKFPVEFMGSILYVKGDEEGHSKTFHEDLNQVLETMAQSKSLLTLDAKWRPTEQAMVGKKTTSMEPSEKELNRDMVEIPNNPSYCFKVSGVELEGGCDSADDPQGVCCTKFDPFFNRKCAIEGKDELGVDVQFPWELNRPRRNHDHTMDIGPFLMDRYPVTREQYKKYLDDTKYEPKDPRHFLKDWEEGYQVPKGTEKFPVTSVSLGEAKAYCKWIGKRLPHTYEWQYAAQGFDPSRQFPWGNEDDAERYPTPVNGNAGKPVQPDPVDAHENGKSYFGVEDMVGNVWQWTSEFEDDHTRHAILRGGTKYSPAVQSYRAPSLPQPYNWYFTSTLRLNLHNKIMLMSDSMDRATTVGFRCVQDVPEGQQGPYHYRPSPATSCGA